MSRLTQGWTEIDDYHMTRGSMSITTNIGEHGDVHALFDGDKPVLYGYTPDAFVGLVKTANMIIRQKERHNA